MAAHLDSRLAPVCECGLGSNKMLVNAVSFENVAPAYSSSANVVAFHPQPHQLRGCDFILKCECTIHSFHAAACLRFLHAFIYLVQCPSGSSIILVSS